MRLLLFSPGRSAGLWKLPLESILLSGKLMPFRHFGRYADTGSHKTALGSNEVNDLVMFISVVLSRQFRHFVLRHLEHPSLLLSLS